ncbi:hypothetical protein [Microtetraspora malaysiensis]|uniref:hypothetical protein n=1 Tax=Microtetraspora malaysiensis TaxID=161358 RepID=UPI00147139FE|nr:hypothetical protein [Microtetraspora malaysiensis]
MVTTNVGASCACGLGIAWLSIGTNSGLLVGAPLDANMNSAWVSVPLLVGNPTVAATTDVNANLWALIRAHVSAGLGLGLGTNAGVALAP